MIFVDTNVLIDVLGDDSDFADWSQQALDRALITRDVARHRTYFPGLSLSAPAQF